MAWTFNIEDISKLIGLKVRRRQATSIDVDCPFCNHKKGKMNLNTIKNVFRCNYCGESGGMVELYGKVKGMNNSEAFAEIKWLFNEKTEIGRLEDTEKSYSILHEIKPKANTDICNETYSMLINELVLAENHKKQLIERGLDIDNVIKNGYRSTPAFGFSNIVASLLGNGCMLEGVPGFYTRPDNTYDINFYSALSGILIPIKSIEGKIQGFQIRVDRPINGNKYIWFSSVNKFKGTSSGSPVHFVGNIFDKTVYVTEGALKADIAHKFSGKTFLAVAGAGQYESLRPKFKQLKEMRATDIVEAYDMDKFTNEYVEKGCGNMIKLANEFGFKVHRLIWNEKFKGIDDWLKNRSEK